MKSCSFAIWAVDILHVHLKICLLPRKSLATPTIQVHPELDGRTLDIVHCFYRGIHADVIVYIFAHLHTTLCTEENLLGIYWLQTAKKLMKRNTQLKF